MSPTLPIILGSQSPQRRWLLNQFVNDRVPIVIRPPTDGDEPDFDDCATFEAILSRVAEIAELKANRVVDELPNPGDVRAVLTCDTVIVAGPPETPVVLGKPDRSRWQEQVREWFRIHYAGRSHRAVSAVHVRLPSGQRTTKTCITRIEMRSDVEELLSWYLATDEPPGKAGGYAIQGLASIFVTAIHGSLTNVVGLPLEVLHAIDRHWDGRLFSLTSAS